ncbi:MAG: YveK family protein [Patescibacteria group bacterium]|jgi:capsular polysaccharide biosynthesis protein
MEFTDFFGLLKKKRQTIFTIVLLAVIFTLLASLTQTMKYTVKSRLLVVQNAASSDAYALSRSNEYLGSLFAEIVYSGSFYDQVIASDFNVNQAYFSGTYSQQVKRWQNTVKTKTHGNTGIVEILVFHPQASEAKKIALSINDILINKNEAYQGGKGVRINIIDQPIASSYPNKPNILNNVIIALFASLLFSLFYIYIFPERKYDLKLFRSRQRPYQTETLLSYAQAEPSVKESEVAPQEKAIPDNTEQELRGDISNLL